MDYHLLIVSDLHLSEGRDPSTRKLSPNEDFFFDGEFWRFLRYYRKPRHGRPWHLLINGDFMDFLQVTKLPDNLAGYRYDRRHPCYGLGCGERETVFKLGVIFAGHRDFFLALADFLARGNRVTIIRGNHDVEFFYPAVQEEFRRLLRAYYNNWRSKLPELQEMEPGDVVPEPANLDKPDAIAFRDWFYYEPQQLWVEHGHQYDANNSFCYLLVPTLPDGPARQALIELPLGSAFVRYLFNLIETVHPFADNIKPVSRFVRWFLTNEPLVAVSFLCGHAGRHFLRRLWRLSRPVGANVHKQRQQEHESRWQQLAQAAGIPRALLQQLDTQRRRPRWMLTGGRWARLIHYPLRWVFILLPWLLVALTVYGSARLLFFLLSPLLPLFHIFEFIPEWLRLSLDIAAGVVAVGILLLLVWNAEQARRAASLLLRRECRDKASPPNRLVQAAEEIAAALPVRYVVMGHTHEADLQAIDRHHRQPCRYFNIATWTRVFGEATRQVGEESELVFLEILRDAQGNLTPYLRKWRDGVTPGPFVNLFS